MQRHHLLTAAGLLQEGNPALEDGQPPLDGKWKTRGEELGSVSVSRADAPE